MSIAERLCSQTSFALGRPDSLGPDEYHTQNLPGLLHLDDMPADSKPDPVQIVPCMVEISRLMRKVGLWLYTQPSSIEEKIARVRELEADLDNWFKALPPHYNLEDQRHPQNSLKSKRCAGYINKQSVVLLLRMVHP